jgi:phage baseplate assembly protein V
MSIDLLRYLGDRIRDAEREADRVYEVVVGLVVDNRDPEQLGRVKVRFPTLPGQDTSHWAPIAALGAGKDRGWWFLPEIDDEVLVAFEHGDIARPVVLGALWNGVDVPPASGSGKDVIVSRNGSAVVFDDEAGTVSLEDGSGKGRITIDKAGTMTIEAVEGDVELQATQGQLSIVADRISLTAGDQLLFHGNGPVAVGSGGNASIRASAISASAAKLDLNPPGGATPPREATAAPGPIDDPIGRGLLSRSRTSSGRS